MSEKKIEELNELSDEQPETADGGAKDSGPQKGKFLPASHKGAYIDKYASERYVGKVVYLSR